MREHKRLIETVRDYQRLWETMREHKRLIETVRDYQRLLETIWETTLLKMICRHSTRVLA